jgi:hypothetical protein
MAEDKAEARELNWQQLLPFTVLFRGFQIALDLNKLLLAAAGIFVMAIGWWLWALIFVNISGSNNHAPSWGTGTKYTAENKPVEKAWQEFKTDRRNWNLMHAAAGLPGAGGKDPVWEVADLADTYAEYDYFKDVTTGKDYETTIERLAQEHRDYLKAKEKDKETKEKDNGFDENKRRESLAKAKQYERLGQLKPAAQLATWPWSEDRGPNPFLFVTGQAGTLWEPGHFWEWLTTQQVPVLIEPLVKLVRPLIFFFSPYADGWTRTYCFFVFLWTVLTWSVFGGAITRIAAVQFARGEKIGLTEALRFTYKRLFSYLTPPLFPLGFVFVLVIFAVLFGLVGMIPVFGDIVVSGFFWIIPLVLGLVMAVFLVGLTVGWPLMAPTISAEGTDAWEAVSRSFSYIFQKPGHYLWYCLVSVVYGAAVVFLIGFLGSFMVYLSKWGVAQTPFIERANREPSYLFIYAPTSYHWRALLLQGAKVNDAPVVENGRINKEVYNRYLGLDEDFNKKYPEVAQRDTLSWWNKAGAVLVALWLGLVFLLLLGFGYSFYFTSATIIYFLMRRQVDAAELDEVYLEEEETEGGYGGPLTPPAPAAAAKPTQPLTMVEPPALKPSTPSSTPPAPPPSPPPPAPSPPPEAATPAPAPAAPEAAPPTPATSPTSNAPPDGAERPPVS